MTNRIIAALLVIGITLAGGGAMAAGAIAVDDEQGSKASDIGYGIGSGSTRDEAGREAMAECKKSGNASCKVAVRYDHCGAYAASSEYSGIGWGDSESEAKANALEACGKGCRIAVSDCQ